MARIERIYKQTQTPHLFDRIIQSLQDGLGELSWMNHIFGRCERLVKEMPDGRRLYTPNVYMGREEYELLTPDNRRLGNYSFFVMEEPQTVTSPQGVFNRLRSPFSLIVWVDMREVERTTDTRDTERVKEDIIKAVRRAWLRHGAVTLDRVYERAENVFHGFSLDETDNQFLMAPFYGLRLTGEMLIDEDCTL